MRRMALAHDESLGKRDDDFRPRRHQRSPSSSMTATFPFRWRRRRVVLIVGVLALICAFHLLVPGRLQTGSQKDTFRPKPARTFQGYDVIRAKEPRGAPPRDGDALEDDDVAKHYYSGPTKFYRLGGTLQKAARTMGASAQNRNVLFVAASMKSVANLIPMACEMAKQDKNHAHFAVFGRSPLTVEVIQELNGIDETCGIHWHDARGDYAEYSSDARVESAVRGAMKHIQEYLHPQVMIMDDSRLEEAFFTTAIQAKAKDMEKALIEIPRGKYEDFLWLTKLGAGSLAHWLSPTIDIVIQAPRGSSGRLIRLLQSLYNADYRGLRVPKLVIELPPDVEPGLQDYLKGFSWPPRKAASQPNLLTVHHRIPSQRMSSEQASLRFVESFYPAQPENHHVLLLSPQAAVSPLYYQYLHYVTLNHRYSTYGFTDADNLLGISLDIPATTLNGSYPFTAPKVSDMSDNNFEDDQATGKDDDTPFLYQAPSAKATLVFGDKWAQFHDFLTNRLEVSHTGQAKRSRKLVSETESAWLEYMLELMSARDWYVLHPAAPLVTIHNELAQIPEEYLRPAVRKTSKSIAEHAEQEPFILSGDAPLLAEHSEAELEQSATPLHKLLPFGGELQGLHKLPYLGFDSNITTASALSDLKDDYVKFFRKAIGGCTGEAVTRPRMIDAAKTTDLFCLPGEPPKYADEVTSKLDLDEVEPIALNTVEDDSETRNTGAGAAAATRKPGMVKLILPEKAKFEDESKEKLD